MHKRINHQKIYDAVYDFLSETMTPKKAKNQTSMMIDNIIDTVKTISELIERNNDTQFDCLSKKFHTLKNLLLYGDFYYESDICQDIEIELRKNKDISNIVPMYDDLVESLSD